MNNIRTSLFGRYLTTNLILGLIVVSSLFAISGRAEVINAELKENLKMDLNYMANIYSRFYAPKTWKEKHLGWNLQDQLNLAQGKIQNAETVWDYRQAAVDFLTSMADYHVGYSFNSTERASLPFLVKTVNGRSVVVYTQAEKLAYYDLKVGDEIIAFDNVPIEKVIEEVKRSVGNNVPGTDQGLVDLYLTNRAGRKNLKVPSGPVFITYKTGFSNATKKIQLVWEYKPEEIPGYSSPQVSSIPLNPLDVFSKLTSKGKNSLSILTSLPKMMSEDALHLQKETFGIPWGLGNRESYLPYLGKPIWTSESTQHFHAYIYQNEIGKLIGVVRIADYFSGDLSANALEFAQIIIKMETLTSALVIDQLNNPGGSVFYLYALASMLTDQGLAAPRHRMALNSNMMTEVVAVEEQLSNIKSDSEAIKLMGPMTEGYPVNYQFVKMFLSFARFYKQQYNAQKKISDPYYVWGIDYIHPHPIVQYTKPILVLVNEMDFSGGDFFPTILQDNHRAVIMGTRTSGAGGWVESVNFTNFFGLSLITMTGSIAERVDKNPIENLGVTPDIELPLTSTDLKTRLTLYSESVRKQIDSMVMEVETNEKDN